MSSTNEEAVCLNRARTVLMGLRGGDAALLPTKEIQVGRVQNAA